MHIIAPFMSCIVNSSVVGAEGQSEFDQAVSQGYGEIFVVGPTGITKFHKLRGENRYVTIKVDQIPGVKFNEIKADHSHFLPAGKVPRRLLEQVEAFFRNVMSTHKDALEAMIWIMYNQENGYFLHVPDQVISKASVRYEWDDVPAGSSIVVDIHSHNTMGR